MVNTKLLKLEIKLSGKTQKEVFEELGLTARQWKRRMALKRFDTDECLKLIKLLHISNPVDVFFEDDDLFS